MNGYLKIISLPLGAFLFLPGRMVLIGGHGGTLLLTQIRASFVPMQGNPALGFFFAAVLFPIFMFSG